MAEPISRGFRDISLSFTRHPVTNDITVIRNEDAIKKSVVNLVRTQVNERFFNSFLGTTLGTTLFELINEESFEFLEDEIEVLLRNFEPRIAVTRVFAQGQVDSNSVFIQIEYDIVGLPLPTQSIEFLLQPTRV
jgi:phage baseplate assembly protein W|tara:strand:+ start:450 stop:851 length:402 start_codon:yes stop_codon:yes gene_type:complete